MVDYNDMTHEELAAEARRVARRNGDATLADLARRLQAAVDDEEPSADIARAVIEALTA